MPKKEKYRLEPLIRLKERDKKRTEMALARAIRELREEEKKLGELKELKKEIGRKREKARTDMRKKVASGKSVIKDSQFHLSFMEKLKEDEDRIDREIKEQEEMVSQAREKLKRAKRDYIDAASELNMMQKHRELWSKKQARLLSALENKQMGELAQVVYQMNKISA